MTLRHPTRLLALPRLWMMTDERQGDGLWPALARLPRGSGVIFRHHSLPAKERSELFDDVRRVARRNGLVLFVAGTTAWKADGLHHRRPGPPRFGTAAAHDIAEIRAAERSGATAVLMSPVFATRSHPGAPVLGPLRFAAMMRATRLPVIALGGIDRRRGDRLMKMGAYGWAAIDAWR
jgi:thiamine-phosphate pyrophosphorylase